MQGINTLIKAIDSVGDPPLPIPNREVKPDSADGTAKICGRVGHRHFYRKGALVNTKAPFFVVYRPKRAKEALRAKRKLSSRQNVATRDLKTWKRLYPRCCHPERSEGSIIAWLCAALGWAHLALTVVALSRILGRHIGLPLLYQSLPMELQRFD